MPAPLRVPRSLRGARAGAVSVAKLWLVLGTAGLGLLGITRSPILGPAASVVQVHPSSRT